MREVRARHWACGTEVVERVPEGYDLSEGLALVCPRCRDAWWYYPEPEPALAGARGAAVPPVEGVPEVPGPPPPRPVAEATATAPRPPHQYSPPPQRPAAERRGNGLVRLWLGPPLLLAAIALLVLALADAGFLSERRTPTPRSPVPSVRPSPPGSPERPAVAPLTPARPAAVTVRVTGHGFWLHRPWAWVTYRRGPALVVAPSRRAPVSLRVYSTRRPDLSLRRMAALSARTLRSRLRGASVSRPRRVRLAGRRGLRVTARRGTTARQMTVLAAGPRRYVLELRSERRATSAQRRTLTAIAGSLRVRG